MAVVSGRSIAVGKDCAGNEKKNEIFLHKDIDFRLLALYIYSPLEKAQASKSNGL
jgi:hypothetical protein